MLTLFINQNESNILQVYFLIFEFRFLILDLNCEKVSAYFISGGSNSQIFGPK